MLQLKFLIGNAVMFGLQLEIYAIYFRRWFDQTFIFLMIKLLFWFFGAWAAELVGSCFGFVLEISIKVLLV